MKRAALAMLWFFLLPVAAVAQEESFAAAKALFERYVQLEHTFDPAVADLYADDALIQNKRTEADGRVREIRVPAPAYKDLIRKAMPLAKTRGDISTYSDVTYTMEGERVRIKATRLSALKKHISPFSLLVGPNGRGSWVIYEELSESQS